MIIAALYARVSSDKQAQENTISSQIEALKKRISDDGHTLLDEHQFVDSGYSGTNIVRPALEKLRDQVASGAIDKIYIHSPDRLSRKYAHQMVLTEEMEKAGAKIIFLNFKSDDTPETHLLLQMQVMIAEYERSKIVERHRRGRIYAAKKGSVNVLTSAAYGYRYIDKQMGGGQARLEIVEEEADILRKIFDWFGKERITLGEIIKRLAKNGIMTRKGKKLWDRSTIWYMLKNPIYKGQAAFGKKKTGKRIVPIRPRKDSCAQPKQNNSRFFTDKENWIYIKVPSIIDKNLFEIVQEQLEENKKRARAHPKGENYLLQGLLMCKHCERAYCGGRSKKSNKIYRYYRCTGSDRYRFGGEKICTKSKQICMDNLDIIVWKEVKGLLENPKRIFQEYQRRLTAIEKSPVDDSFDLIEKKKTKLKRGISLLIDSYAQEYINKDEFEHRIKSMKQNLKILDDQQKKLIDTKNTKDEITLLITDLKCFASGLVSKLDNLSWSERRDVIRMIVKRIEIESENINIVYKINDLQNSMEENNSLQHCCNRMCEFLRIQLKPLKDGFTVRQFY